MGNKKNKTEQTFKKGDLVFAKVKGFSFWPARVEEVKINEKRPAKTKYKVFFYGTYETYTLKREFILPFDENTKEIHGKEKKVRGFNEGMLEIENEPDIAAKDKIENDDEEEEEDDLPDDGGSVESDHSGSVSSNSNAKIDETTAITHGRKRRKSIDSLQSDKSNSKQDTGTRRVSKRLRANDDTQVDEVEQPVEQPKRDESKRRHVKEVKKETNEDLVDTSRRRRATMANGDLKKSVDEDQASELNKRRRTIATNDNESKDEEAPDGTSKTKRKKVQPAEDDVKLKVEVKHEVNDTASEAVAIRKSSRHRNVKEESVDEPVKKDVESEAKVEASENAEEAPIEQCQETRSAEDENIKEKQDNEENKEVEASETVDQPHESVKESPSQEKPHQRKMSKEELNEEKQRLKRRKMEEKKREKLKNIRIELALLKMDREIKKSLQVDNTDENRCCLIMDDLIKLPFTQRHLFKAPEIVETIKKCRKYKNSERVRSCSNDCFNKLQMMFEVPQGDTFSSVFDREREKYLAEHMDELKKERVYANKLQQIEIYGYLPQISTKSKNQAKLKDEVYIESPISSSTSTTSSTIQSPS